MNSTTQRLVVEVVGARNLLPKDGHGTSSPYVAVDYYGQRRRTQTAVGDVNPTWNEVLEFSTGKPSEVFDDILELSVFHDKSYGPTRRNLFLGRLRLSSSQFVRKGEEALIYFPLEKKNLFSWVQGDIGLKIYYADAAPTQPPEPETKPAEPEPAPTPAPAEASSEPAATEEKSEQALEQPDNNVPEGQTTSEPLPPQDSVPENVSSVEPPPPPPPPPPEPSVDAVQREGYEVDTTVAADVKFKGPQPIRRPISGDGFSLSDPFEIMTTPVERPSFDLVEKMHYVFVRVVRARSLPTNGSPVVKISVSNHRACSKPARKTAFFDWDETFAFSRDSPESSSILEISVWDPSGGRDGFMGGICFDAGEIPLRDPPDSPLAPQWYRLEGGGAHHGDIMLATWVGTQADDSFPDAWKTDTAGNPNARAKVYQSPKLWYLRATVLEAQDVVLPAMTPLKELTFQIKAQLGFQALKTKPAAAKNGAPSWNEDLLFVVAEPFGENLVLTLETRSRKGSVPLGNVTVPLTEVERRVDERKVSPRWFNVENAADAYGGRLHLRLCYDGGYHVMDEAANTCSDYRPTARQLWKPPVGTVELGIILCKNLVPVKTTATGKGCTDAYCVAKYGPKWIRTRTVSDSLDPKWNEQYTFQVFDPCTTLTIGVFDSWEGCEIDCAKDAPRPDFRIGKVRVRISALAPGKINRNTYPLFVLSPVGLKTMGEVEIAVRFVRACPKLDFIHAYSQPLMPAMHHLKPLGAVQQDMLRTSAVKIISAHLSRSEPPLRREAVLYMLDADSQAFSIRKLRANYLRIVNVTGNVIDAIHWVDDTRTWKNPTATALVHALLVMLVWFPDLIVPTLAFYVFAIGAWNYRFRSRIPLPHFDPKLSLAEAVDRDELDEEFDLLPSRKLPDEVRARYDKLRVMGAKVQVALGDLAAQGERVQALVTWRDPCATGIFIALCFVLATVMYLVPSKMVAMASGFYYFRHPIFRDRMPSPVLNFFRRLPSLSDRIM